MTAYNTLEELESYVEVEDFFPLLVDDDTLLLSNLVTGDTQVWIRNSELETWSRVSDLTPPGGETFVSIICGTRNSTHIAIPTLTPLVVIYSNNGNGSFSLANSFSVSFVPSDIKMTNDFIFLWNKSVASPSATIEIYDYTGTLTQTIILDGALYRFTTVDCLSCWEDILAIGVVQKVGFNSKIIIYKYTSSWIFDTIFDLGYHENGIPRIDCASNRIAVTITPGPDM